MAQILPNFSDAVKPKGFQGPTWSQTKGARLIGRGIVSASFRQSVGRHFLIALFTPSLLVLCLLAGQGCSKQVGQWDVFGGKAKVLWIKEEPGALISTGMPPAGAEPVMHPFLTGVAEVPEEEDRLGRLLRSAKTFDEFVCLLKRDGYTLKPSSEQREPNKSLQDPP